MNYEQKQIIKTMRKLLKKRITYFYIALAVAFLFISCSSGESESLGLMDWLKSPLTKLSIGNLLVMMILVAISFN